MKSYRYLNGFSLLEVLMALSIFAFGLLGFASLQMHAYRLSEQAMEKTLNLLEQKAIRENIAQLGVDIVQ